jgi:hypothetical protein
MKTFIFYFVILVLLLSFDAKADTCRDAKVKRAFDISQGYPHGRKGYVVDHICALANGGLDSIINLQYQTIIEAKVKDKIENTEKGRLLYCNENNSTMVRQVFNCK